MANIASIPLEIPIIYFPLIRLLDLFLPILNVHSPFSIFLKFSSLSRFPSFSSSLRFFLIFFGSFLFFASFSYSTSFFSFSSFLHFFALFLFSSTIFWFFFFFMFSCFLSLSFLVSHKFLPSSSRSFNFPARFHAFLFSYTISCSSILLLSSTSFYSSFSLFISSKFIFFLINI